MIRKIDHIGIAVADAEKALAVFRDALGLEALGSEAVESQQLITHHLRVGETELELLCPTAEDSPVGRFLAKRGEGIHHVALAVEDIERELPRLIERGLKPLGDGPSIGAGGKRVLFFHPKTTGGVLLELCDQRG